MFLSKRSNGKYYIFYNNGKGKRTCVSTKTKIKSEALKYLSNFRKNIENNSEEKILEMSVKDFFWEYLKYSEGVHSKNTTLSIKSTVNALNEYFGNRYINQITINDLSQYIHYRLAKTSPYVARREMAYLSAAFNYGIARNYLAKNHIKEMKKIKLPEKQPLFFSKEEFARLLSVIENIDFKDAVVFALYTGLRQMELITLEWNQIDFNNKLIVLNNRNHLTKSKKIRSIPLNDIAMDILTKRYLNKKGNVIFTYNGNPMKQLFISHKFKKYVRKAEDINQNLSFHSLRHTFASWLVQKGVSLYIVSKLMGHSDTKTTQIYSHLRTEDLQSSINLLN